MYKYIYIYHISLGWKLHVVVHFCWGWHEAPRRGRQTQGGAPPWGEAAEILRCHQLFFWDAKWMKMGYPPWRSTWNLFLNTPLKEGDSFWKPSFSGSMLNFGGAPSLKLTYLRFSHLKMDGVEDDDCFPPFGAIWVYFQGLWMRNFWGFILEMKRRKDRPSTSSRTVDGSEILHISCTTWYMHKAL